MKKVVFVLLIALFVVNNLHAQSTDALTNATIIKMVKGKLSDDLIIDEINSSKVNFDLSDESIKTLLAGNVSDKVIQAMKAAKGNQTPTAPAEIIPPAPVTAPAIIPLPQTEVPVQPEISKVNDTTEKPAAPEESVLTKEVITTIPVKTQVEEVVIQPEKEQIIPGTLPTNAFSVETSKTENGTLILIEKLALTIDAVSYVIPVADLIPFYNKEFSSLAGVIQEWDKKIRASLEKERKNTESISKVEKELTDKKNADAKPFSNEIIEKKKNLVLLWEKHKTIKNDMVTEGKSLVEELKKISKETESSIETKFKDVSKKVKSTDPDPSAGETAKEVSIPKQRFKSTIAAYFAPVAMMLVCYQNEIITIQSTIATWNEKAIERIKKDSELKRQLAPLQNELTQYLATTKQNQKVKKKEISALKKQCDNIEKERKQLAKQMVADSDKLSEDLIKMKDEVQGVVRERFTDIIENIEHSYQDKFNL